MKVLFDPIYTNDPRFCSNCYKMQQAAKYLLEKRDDVFITFLLPSNDDGSNWTVEYDWLLKHPRLSYETIPTSSDRMKEYYRFSDEYRKKVAFFGEHWDHDMVVTSRISGVPLIKTNMTAMRANRPLAKQVVTIEDMPILNFKKCVAQTQPDVQDLQHVTGYLAADANWFMSFWEKDAMLRVARGILAPSKVMELAKKSFDASPIQVEGVSFKKPADVKSTAKRTKPFTVGYTQRFEAIHRRSNDVMEIFEKQWVFRGGKHKMRFISTSNSKGGAATKDNDFIEFLRPPREEFWRIMREEVDVIIVLSIDDAYPLSLIEPLLNGTPVALLRAPYAEATVGKDYPFFVSNEVEAYGVVKAFFDDYEGQYEKFRLWSESCYGPLMFARNKLWWPPLLLEQLNRLEKTQAKLLGGASKTNSVIDLLVQKAGDEFVLFDAIRELKKDGEIRHLADSIGKEAATAMSFTISWNEQRLRLIHHHGFKDASTATGHFKRG